MRVNDNCMANKPLMSPFLRNAKQTSTGLIR